MANEDLNVRVHNAGFFHYDWNYYTDASLDRAYSQVNTSDGVDSGEVMTLLQSTTDFDQITAREARQLYGVFAQQSPVPVDRSTPRELPGRQRQHQPPGR
jgi:hypothetical protein